MTTSNFRTTPKPIAVIAGLGNAFGTGGSTARLFAAKGYRVALLGRSRTPTSQAASSDSLTLLADSINASGGEALPFPLAAYDAIFLKKAFEDIEKVWEKNFRFGLFNAGDASFGGFLDIGEEKLRLGIETSVIGAFTFGQEVVKAILASTTEEDELKGHRGSLIYTGATAALRGSNGFGAFAAGKFGIRAISQSIAREFQVKGIHTAHVIIDGSIQTDRSKQYVSEEKLADPRKVLNPDSIAKAYWYIHEQDPSAWTQELDLRPAHEKW